MKCIFSVLWTNKYNMTAHHCDNLCKNVLYRCGCINTTHDECNLCKNGLNKSILLILCMNVTNATNYIRMILPTITTNDFCLCFVHK